MRTARAALRRPRGIPGLSVAIAEGGVAGYGLADIETEVEAGPETVYRLASVSMPMAAVAALPRARSLLGCVASLLQLARRSAERMQADRGGR